MLFVEAISIPIVYNKYGDHDPNGMLYVLKKDSERIRRKAQENFEMQPPQPYKEVQPLVIRANKGDEIRINFYNSLGRRASMHVQGLRYDVLTSDGAFVANNPDSTTCNFISYVWYAEKEGVYLFSDLGEPSGGEDVKCGRKKPIPLILRANAGDWIEITLHNMFDKPVLYHDYPSVPLDMPFEPSDRVSLSPQHLKHCPVYSAGVKVGFNKPEQTAAPGECIKYLWYADKEYGTCMLSFFGDLRNHRYHGLFGAIIIEPPAAKYYGDVFCKKRGIRRTGSYNRSGSNDL